MWSVVKPDFLSDALSFLNNGILSPKANLTIIVLIPKIERATRLQEYRPISLCTILMRTVSKVLTSRLQLIIDKLISPNQSASIRGTNIIDNVVISQEVLHFMKTTASKINHWGP